ncbi:hypothetical protein IQ243_12450 [Nostocales cyanobacterium LEGE 11386]|nr:hypothetical protein [Nostocales cyanobacterium LEGE 11386]
MLSRLHVVNKSRLAATASVLDLTSILGACVTKQASDISGGTATTVDLVPVMLP